MKKFIYIVIFSFVFSSCGGGGGSDPKPTPEPEAENRVPSVPTLSAPINGELCIDNSVSFQWNIATDPDGDAISYQIQVATDNQFNQIANTLSGSSTSKTISLEKGKAYYWRVKATDSKNLSSAYSSIFNFYTEGNGETNHIPFSPELVQPEINEVLQTTTATLKWNANDVDTNDNLSFDVYFGTVNPPTIKISDNLTSNLIEVDIVASTNYYWKVVVSDGNGGEAIGQVWNFKTD